MDDVRDRLKLLDTLEPPEQWAQIETGSDRSTGDRGPSPWRRLAIATVALSIAAGTLVLVRTAFDRGDDPGPSVPTPAIPALASNGLIAVARGSDIVLVDPDDMTARNITQTPEVWESQPAWSPDGAQIVFVGCSECTEPDLYVMDADGSDRRRLTSGPAMESNPAWAPDGVHIAFERGGQRTSAIWVLSLVDGGEVRLTDEEGLSGSPSWSPDGTRLAIHSGTTQVSQIVVMDADGTNPEILTDPSLFAGSPTWAPDGSVIAFSTLDTARGESWIYTVSPSGSDARRIGEGSSPTWAPDGTMLAVLASSGLEPNEVVLRLLTPQGDVLGVAAVFPQGEEVEYVKSPGWQPIIELPSEPSSSNVPSPSAGSTCVFPPYRPTYLPWLNEGESVPEPEVSRLPGGGVENAPSYALIGWTNGNDRYEGGPRLKGRVVLWRSTESLDPAVPNDPAVPPLPGGGPAASLTRPVTGLGEWSIVWWDPSSDPYDDPCSYIQLGVNLPNLSNQEARREALLIAESLVPANQP